MSIMMVILVAVDRYTCNELLVNNRAIVIDDR